MQNVLGYCISIYFSRNPQYFPIRFRTIVFRITLIIITSTLFLQIKKSTSFLNNIKLFTLVFSLIFSMYYHIKYIKLIWTKKKVKRLIEISVNNHWGTCIEICIILIDWMNHSILNGVSLWYYISRRDEYR